VPVRALNNADHFRVNDVRLLATTRSKEVPRVKKKYLVAGVLAVAAFASIAATCVVKSVSLQEIDGDMVYGAELKNETTVDFLGHRFVVAFLDDDLDVIQTRTVDGCLRSLQANTSNFYSTTYSGDPDDVEVALSRLALDGTLKVGSTANGDLDISDAEAVRDGETLTVTGTITSDENDSLEDVRACAVVYDEDGNVVRTQRDSDTFDMEDGDSNDFSIDVTVPDDSDLAHHVSVWVDAINDDESNTATEPVGEEDIDVDIAAATPTPSPSPTATATP
jgi:hypothetical protein